MATVLLFAPSWPRPARIPTNEEPGKPLRNACTPREKSRLSITLSTVWSSGKPSKNLSVPRRVSTESGVVICGGISVVIFIFGVVCAWRVVMTAVAPISAATSKVGVFMVAISSPVVLVVSWFSCSCAFFGFGAVHLPSSDSVSGETHSSIAVDLGIVGRMFRS
jgi:hypothetical protein